MSGGRRVRASCEDPGGSARGLLARRMWKEKESEDARCRPRPHWESRARSSCACTRDLLTRRRNCVCAVRRHRLFQLWDACKPCDDKEERKTGLFDVGFSFCAVAGLGFGIAAAFRLFCVHTFEDIQRKLTMTKGRKFSKKKRGRLALTGS